MQYPKHIQELMDKTSKMMNSPERLFGVYGLTEEEAEVFKRAYNNIDTEEGYRAYAELEILLTGRPYTEESYTALVELAVSFCWDERLCENVDRILKEMGREDLVSHEDGLIHEGEWGYKPRG